MAEQVYLFYGDDYYIIKQKTNQIVESNNIDEFNVTTYDMEETNIEDAINDATTIPFMADIKAVIVKNAYFLSTDTSKRKELHHNLESLKRYLEHPAEGSLLIVQVPFAKLDERKAITKHIKKIATVEHCTPLKDQDLRGWVKRQLGKHGISIDADALNELLNRVENNTEVLVSETTKLVLYAEDLNRVDLDIVKKVITKNVEDNVYEITNSILANERGKALEIYNDLIMHSEDPLRILGILVNKYREILHTKMMINEGRDKAAIASYFNATSGRTYYIMKNARSVHLDDVENQLKKLEELDYKIKTGQIDKKIGLELFILGT
ncbi:DNA polymerase III subunit delta [Candidatus Xianfuyuplasma coldseepsis]|uniref:DNA polymerase III subunit delta n=1 Tax=Candidatus Xianfuyuplasma coldseepsis TaxID=2782163 RepID=A0A7L7KS29_9MOLU|nr:DNA polymerase III subunit delta [Xianfuyuplasma coldseepsis]QMS85630.1 DNA polymerase III subunit delta [Xianfuyuplasma coldseepsis]